MGQVTRQFLGSGDAFGSGGRFQTCFLLRGAQGSVLIDCGASSLIAMRRAVLRPTRRVRRPGDRLFGRHRMDGESGRCGAGGGPVRLRSLLLREEDQLAQDGGGGCRWPAGDRGAQEVTCATKPALAQGMLARALAAGG